MIANRLRIQEIPRDVRDAFLDDLEENRDKLVEQTGKLPIRLGKAILLVMAADYSGVFKELTDQVPALKPVLERLKKSAGLSDNLTESDKKDAASGEEDADPDDSTGIDL
jgi:hypothetical protein